MSRLRRHVMLVQVTVRDLRDDPTAGQPVGELAIRIATRAELLTAADEFHSELKRPFVEAALSRGDVCAAAFDGAHIVAFTWATYTAAPHGDGLWVRVDPPHSYSYKSFTRPAYRGRRLIQHCSVLRDRVGRERGFARSVGFIETHNYSSFQTYRRLDARGVGYAGYLKAFGSVLPFRTPGVARVGFRFYPATSEAVAEGLPTPRE